MLPPLDLTGFLLVFFGPLNPYAVSIQQWRLPAVIYFWIGVVVFFRGLWKSNETTRFKGWATALLVLLAPVSFPAFWFLYTRKGRFGPSQSLPSPNVT
jgi:uncharacterized membrane protein YiaA